MRHEAITGLAREQVDEVVARVTRHLGTDQLARPGGRPSAPGLYGSVVLVIHLIRRNPVQAVAAEFFGVSQSTVSRRWDLLRPTTATVLADLIPHPRAIIRGGTALADGTVCPTWDWKMPGGLFSRKAGYPGMNVQIACDMDGELAAIGPVPVPGARHDAHAYAASGLRELMNGITSTPPAKPPPGASTTPTATPAAPRRPGSTTTASSTRSTTVPPPSASSAHAGTTPQPARSSASTPSSKPPTPPNSAATTTPAAIPSATATPAAT